MAEPNPTVGSISAKARENYVWDRHRLRKFSVMMCSVMLLYLAMDMEVYAVNEYTQNLMKSQYSLEDKDNTNYSACKDFNHSSPGYMNYTIIQQETSNWVIYYTVATVVPTIPMSIVYQSYTDTYGRRFLFILATFGIFLKLSISAVVIYTKSSLLYIVVGCVIQGLVGSSYSVLASSYSYVADITPAGSKRSFLLALNECLLITSSTVTVLASGYFIQYTGFFYPSLTGACLALLSLLGMVFFVEESLDISRRSTKPSIMKNIKRTFEFYTTDEFKGRRKAYILLLLTYTFSYLCGVHRRSLETLYQLGMPFCWAPTQIGFFASLRQGGQGIIGIASTKLFQRCQSDEAVAFFSLLSNAISYLLEAFAKSDLVLYLVAVPATFAFASDPMIRGLMSAMTSDDKQGALFASLTVVQSLCWLTATLADNSIYNATLSVMNGLVFLVLAGVAGVAILFLCLFIKLGRKTEETTYRVHNDETVDVQ